MGVFRQLGALFWKNYVIRKRQPFILVLEVLWPILMFVVIGLMRTGSPPIDQETCSYPERAMPSAGMIPFLQSSVCTIDNKCSKSEETLQRASAQQRLRTMVADIVPVLSKDTTLTAIKALPTLNVVLEAIQDVTNGTNIGDLDDKLQLRKMVSDPDAVASILSTKYNVMSWEAANALLDSSLNVVELMGQIGYMDFKGVVCDPVRLQKVFMFKLGTDISAVSQHLCDIEDELISKITNDLTKQLDVANIVTLAKDFANFAGAFDVGVLFQDMANLAAMYMDSSSLLNGFMDMMELAPLKDVFGVIGDVMPLLAQMEDLDFNSLATVYEVVDPMITSLTNDAGLSDSIRQMLSFGTTMTEPTSESITRMLEELMPLLNSSLPGIMEMMGNVDVDAIYSLINLIMNGNGTVDMSSISTSSLEQSMGSMEMMMSQVMGENMTAMIMSLADNMMDMMDEVMTFTTDLSTDLQYNVLTNEDLVPAMTALAGVGTDMGDTFLTQITTTDNVLNILKGETTMKVVCLDTASSVLSSMTQYQIQQFTDVVCTDGLTGAVDTSISPAKYSVFTDKMEVYISDMDAILQGEIPTSYNTSMEEMSVRMTQMIEKLMTQATGTDMSQFWDTMIPLESQTQMYYYEWVSVWNNVGEQYSMQNRVFLNVLLVGESVEKTSLWSSIGNIVKLCNAIMDAVIQPLRKLDEMSAPTEPLYQMSMYSRYIPDLMEAIVNNYDTIFKTIDLTGLSQTGDILEPLCNLDNWAMLSLPSYVPEADMRNFICTTNWTVLMDDLLTVFDPLSAVAQIEAVFMENDANGMDWMMFVDNMNYLIDVINKGKTNTFVVVMNNLQLDMTRLTSMYDLLMNTMMNMTAEQLSSYSSTMADGMTGLDMALGNMSFYIEMKYYVRISTLYAKLMTKYMEETQSEQFDVVKFVTDQSPTLGSYVNNATTTTPGLLDALQTSLMKPDVIIQLVLSNYSSLCNEGSISAILGLGVSSEVATFERGLCNLNWTHIIDEMMSSTEELRHISDIYAMFGSGMTLPDIALNWTEVFATYESFMMSMSSMTTNMPTWDLGGLNANAINDSITEIINMALGTSEYDIARILGIVNGLESMLDIFMVDTNDTLVTALRQMYQQQIYISYQYLTFANKHLEYFNSTDTVDIKSYIDSSEMNKLFDFYAKSGELNAVVWYNMQRFLMDASKLMEVFGNLESICDSSKPTFANTFMLPENSTVTIQEVQSQFCGLNLDTELLLDELTTSLDGLQEFIDAMTQAFNGSTSSVNYTMYIMEYEHHTKLFEALITSPPDFILPWPSTEDPFNMLMEQLQMLEMDFNQSANSLVGSMENIQEQIYTSLQGLQAIPEMNRIMEIAKFYAIMVENILRQGQVFDPASSFQNYPEMRELWMLMDSLPEVFETYTYTSIVAQDKITKFTELLVQGLDVLCMASPGDLMTVPPTSDFDFTDFFNKFCSLDMMALEQEFTNLTNSPGITYLYGLNWNDTVISNLTDVISAFESLMTFFTEEMTITNDTTLPRFFNMTLWGQSLEMVSQLLMGNDSMLFQSPESIQEQIYSAIMTLQASIPEINKLMEIARLYAVLVEKFFTEGQVLDPANSFADQPEMRKVWQLLDYLPEVYQTYTYTSLVDQEKVTTFLELLTQGLDVFCAANPDDLMTVPADLDFSFTDFFQSFCAINMTALEEEYMSITNQQGIMDLYDIPWNQTISSNITEFMATFESLMNIFTEDMTNTSDASLPRFLDSGLWEMATEFVNNLLMNQSNLNQFGGAGSSLQMLPSDDMTTKLVATVNLVMDLLIEKMQELSENITLETLTRNSTDLIKMLESVGRLNDLDMATLNQSIDIEQLLSIIQQPETFMAVCENGTFAMMISPSGVASPAAMDLENVMCIDTTALLASLQDQVSFDMFEQKLSEIWNSTEGLVAVDWTAMTEKVETMVGLLMHWIETPPTIGADLMNWLDINSTIHLITELFMNPAVLTDLSNNIDPTAALGPGNEEYNALSEAISESVTMLIEKLTESNVTLTSFLMKPNVVASLLQDMIDGRSTSTVVLAMSNPEQFMNVLLDGNWETTVCDLTEFTATFTFPAGVTVYDLQQDLCEQTQGQGLSIVSIFSDIGIEGTMEQLIEQLSQNLTESEMTEHLAALVRQYFGDMIVSLDNNAAYPTLESWFQPIMSVLEMSVSQNTDSMIAMCESTVGYIENTEYYHDNLQPYLDQAYIFTQISVTTMNLLKDVDMILCTKETNDLTAVVQMMKDKQIPQTLQWLAEKLSGDVVDLQFTCVSMVTASTDLYTGVEASLMTLANDTDNNILTCVTDTLMASQDIMNNITKLFSLGSEMMDVLQDDSLQMFITELTGSNTTAAMIDELITLLMQQQNAVSQLESTLQNDMADISTFLENTLGLGQEALFSVLKQYDIIDMANMSASELLQKFCDGTIVQDSLDMDPVLYETFVELNKTLCGDNQGMAQDVAENLVQLSDLASKLGALAYSSDDPNVFWQAVSDDLSALAGNIEGLSELSGLVSSLGNIDITKLEEDSQLLYTMERLLLDNGPNELLTSLNAVLDNFQYMGDNMTSDIITDIRIMADGVFAFNSLRSLLLDTIAIKDLVTDEAELRRYMTETLQLPESVATAIVDGTLRLETLLLASKQNISEWICNVDQLSKTLKIEDKTYIDAAYISTQFCNLNTSTITQILGEVMQHLSIGDFMEEMILNGVNAVLKDANVTIEETADALTGLQNAQEELKNLMVLFDDFTAEVPNAVATLTQAQTGANTMDLSSISALICGDPIPAITDDLNTGTLLDRADLTLDQQQDLDQLDGKACKDMYLSIMEKTEGPIIWGYLKPLLQGKILYTPDTPVTRSIVAKMNTTFASMEEIRTIAEDWATGSVVLGDLLGDQASSVQDVMSSPLVSSMLSQLSGVTVSELDTLFYNLNDTDSDLVKSLSNLAQLTADYLKCVEFDRFVGVATENEMETKAAELDTTRNLLAGIVFENLDNDSSRKKRQTSDPIPEHITYKIRMDIDNVAHSSRIKQRMWRPIPEDSYEMDLRYFRGFMQLQDMIDNAIIDLHTGPDDSRPSVITQQFPFICHKQDTFVNAFSAYLLPVLMTIAWLAGLSVAVNNLVYDREQGQEETLRAMGLRSSLNWWAWFISSMFVMAAVAFVCVIIVHYWNIFTNSNIAILYLYFIDFLFSALMLCYFISAFFTRTSLAILATLIVYLISYLPFTIIISVEVKMEFWHKVLACLASTSAFSFSAQYIARYEEQQIGIQWDNIADSPVKDDDFSFQWGCLMMLIDGCIYLVLGWYVRNVKPGKFGVSEPLYFFLLPSYWFDLDRSSSKDKYAAGKDVFVEEYTGDAPVVMSVKGLCKEYTHGKPVVNNLSMDIHSGSVTTLLGYNGAAKTTTMNMLIGLLEPTKGSVKIFNNSNKRMRQCLGVCPQQNSLFEYMTVQEHMEFYNDMKSTYTGAEARADIKQLLKDVDLYYCRHSMVKTLSGGMQRKLCVVLAFVGGSKAVVLDEPTSGVDPSGRRAIWNLIIRRKLGKGNQSKSDLAVLLSTHHLDEADIISDRIAIMHEGSLLCHGSPLFLKHHFAKGHRLTATKIMEATDTDPVPVLSKIQQHIPGARLHQCAGHELSFVLPPNQNQDFVNLFHDLEVNKDNLMVESYGITDPTLEEVFLKVCRAADVGKVITPESVQYEELPEKQPATPSTVAEWSHDMEGNGANRSKQEKTSGCSLMMLQFGALLSKRFNHYRRNWRMFLCVFLLPLLLFLLASGLYTVRPNSIDAKNRLLSPAMYGPDSYVFAKQSSSYSLPSSIIDSFTYFPGISTTCMEGMDFDEPYKCITSDFGYTTPTRASSDNISCMCDDYRYTCTGSVAPPPQLKTQTTDILQDLEGRDIEQYLLDTFNDFTEKRYGGWSFHDDDTNSLDSGLAAKIWFNNKGHHALPAFYNAYSNGLLRALINQQGLGQAENFGITAYNHPFLFNKEQLSRETIHQGAADAGIAVVILLSFTFIPVGVLMFVTMENINKDKQLQFISGIGPGLYWTASLIWDMLILILATACAFGIMAIFQHDSFWDRNNAPAVVSLILLFGWATIPLSYCTVKLFKTVSSAFFTVFCTLNFVGVVCIVLMFTLNFFKNDSTQPEFAEAYRVCHRLFLIFPPYALGGGLIDLIENTINTSIFARFNTDVYVEPFTFDLIGWHLVAMGIEGLLFFILAILLDTKLCSSKRGGLAGTNNTEYEDEDVKQERQRIHNGDSRNDVVVVKNLHKVYPSSDREVHAVNGLTFGVPRGQCFGLLGVNGAGKSTTFKILTGTLDPSDGEAHVLGKSVSQGSTSLGHNMGYCPQEEALDLFLSVEEMLYFHCKLKGITDPQQAVSSVVKKLALEQLRHKVVKNCSGGMKRKLSLAIALLGDPNIILLDEPTTGMDPKAKRQVWDCLLAIKQNGQGIILTSHSMEECDVLCDRIGIMVNGEFKCMGSSQRLKNKFGQGFTVTLNVCGLSTTKNRIYELMASRFPGTIIRDQHQNNIQLDIPKDSHKISDIFALLEREKTNYNIMYYTVSQTTLETVFLNFAEEQHDGILSTVESDINSSSAGESFGGDQFSGKPVSGNFYGYMNNAYSSQDELFKKKLQEQNSVEDYNPIITKM